MTQRNYKMADINGLLPSVEPARSDELYALSGRNYVFDVRGPRSIFGNRLLLPHPLGAPAHAQGIRVELRTGLKTFTCTSDSILEWDESLGGWRMVFVLAALALSPYRWTWAYLGDVLYFCHPRTGILVYNPTLRICVPHNGPGRPAEALSIVENNGFLTVVTPELFAWSAPSDGMNFAPSLGGAGFQVISERVSGYPIMGTSYVRGVLTWTTGGVMRSEFTGDAEVFRHTALQTQYKPINSFCTARVDDDSVIILDKRGLFQTKGDQVTPLAPMFNEFISDYIRETRLEDGQNIRLEWDDVSQLMFLSVSESYADAMYEQAFVLYTNLDKWGQFNEPHYGILPIRIADSDRDGSYMGFVDATGRVRYWLETGSREASPETVDSLALANLGYPVIGKPPSYSVNETGTILSSSGVANTVPSALLSRAGYYGEDAELPLSPTRIGLDSVLRFGLFRLATGETDGGLSEVINVKLRNAANDKTYVVDGFNLTPPVNTAADYEYEANPERRFLEESYVNHKLNLVGTIDAETIFDSQVPTLVEFSKSMRNYSCSVTGLWHILELEASEVGEFFHVTVLELTSIQAGQL